LLPADALLRSELKSQKRLAPDKGREISHAVFAYFRWFGWLDQKATIRDQLAVAIHLAERFASLERGQPCPREFSDGELVSRAVPHWLSTEMQITPAWAHSLQPPSKLWLRARPGTGPALAARLSAHKTSSTQPFGSGPLSDVLEYRGDQDLFRTHEFHAGNFELQDISSQAVGLICAPLPGQTWWDACAGEGGKTLHLCDLMGNKGLVWASDRAEWRLKKLKRRAARSRIFNYRARVWDGGPKLPVKTKFDGILVDAPCSGTGTWQRNPHARWTTTAQDVHELAGVQLSLLLNTAGALKPQGNLIYSVCTTTRAETVQVAKAFDARMPSLARLELKNPLQPDAPAVKDLFLRSEDTGGNGMFVAGWTLTR